MIFPSKKDWWLGVIILGSAVLCLAIPFIEGDWIAGVLLLPLGGGMLWLWFSTRYILTDEKLIVRYGPFRHEIAVSAITNVRKTKNPFSSPALSLKRLEINYSPYGTILISPKNRDDFIRLLLEINPGISVGSPF
ncbi:PH domain-containing protein [Indiicoccus explosivorum]|uniref:PH domain-containing protein n=1 Tax=Indiicoccus explosivorum TaxID=1917864 RepID=UPI000B42E9EC|nr:PH domain-containing protein [Indiicoccus explosivorum]